MPGFKLPVDRFGNEKDIRNFDVLPTSQPTPAATGHTTNLGCIFKDATGQAWAVDMDGDALPLGASIFKEALRWYADPNGLDTNNGANESPKLTAQAAVNATTQAGTTVLNEGTYGAVTMSLQNTTLSGASNGYSGLVNIASLAVTTASGTSNRVEGLTVTGNVTHSGGAPLYLNNVSVNGNYASTSAAYEEIKDSRIQSGTITKTTAGTLFIRDSQIGNATFNTPGSVIALDNVVIDAGKTLTIGAGVVYSLGTGTSGHIVIDPNAIPAATAAEAAGLTGDAAKDVEVANFNDIRLTNVPTVTGATKMLVRDQRGLVSEQNINPVTTSVTPQYGNGTAHVNAQSNAKATVADVLKLSDGTLINNVDVVTWTGHGLALHNWYYLSPTTAGGYTNVQPVAPNYSQRLFYTVDANTIKVQVQQAEVVAGNTTFAPETRAYPTGTGVSTHNTLVDVAGSSLTLQPGIYELGYDVQGFLDNNGNGNMVLSVQITDAANVAVAGSSRPVVTASYVTGYSGTFKGSASFRSTQITITTATTYKLRMIKSSTGGTPNTGQNMAIDGGSYLYAKRIN